MNPWCVAHRANPKACLRLVCFPYAGASASIFRSWYRWLPQEVEVCGVQLPGRQNRISESPFTRMAFLIEELGPALLPWLDRPFVFFGHSMGALVIFEMTRWLRRIRYVMPKSLFVSGRRAPQIPDTGPPHHLMNDSDFIAEIRKLKATPEEILGNAEILKSVLPVVRADTELCETYDYQYEPPLSCPIIAFAGVDDDEETVDRMAAWRLQTERYFTLHPVQGDHFFIHSNERRLVEMLRMELDRT